MKQKTQMSSLINIITVILIAGAVVLGGVKIWSQWTDANPDTAQQVDKGESEPESAEPEANATGAAVAKEEYTPAENVAEIVAEVEEEIEDDTPPQDQTDEPEPEPEPEPEMEMELAKPTDETAKEPQQSFDMRKMWNDLNLTPAEQARLGQGFALAMQRWQNMPPEVRQAETARLQGMRIRFEAMTPDEQEQAMQRMMQRFDQWRRSDSIELPELSLD